MSDEGKKQNDCTDWSSISMRVLLFSWYVISWTIWTLLIREVQSQEKENEHYSFDILTVVLCTEFFKLVSSLIFHFSFIPLNGWKKEYQTILNQSEIGIYFAIPSIIYNIYNVLMYVNLTLFTPTNYRVLINIRVLWSGILFQIIFQTKLGLQKWVSLGLLMIGCCVNQISSDFTLETNLFALGCLAFQAFLSSAGGVYSEYLLKSNPEISLFVKNLYLYFWSCLGNLIFILCFRQNLLVDGTFFDGWDLNVIFLVFLGTICGFSTAVFLRYLNVLLKEFAHSIEMVLTALLTAAYFGHPLTLNVLLSIFLVGVAILLSYLAREKNG